MHHIVILTHQHDEFDQMTHLLHGVCQVWRENGIKVTVLRGVGPRVEADLAILHVDVTVVPDEYIQFMRLYPVAINPTVKDISKRHISANLVHRGDGYEGPVIVKTNRNYGGGREAEMAQQSSWFAKYARALRRRLPWSLRAELDVWEYPIFDSVSQLPRAVWHNPDLIVDRFLPERRDGFYCMRSWIFLGDAEENNLMYANQPIIKSKVAVRIEEAQVPDELRKMRRELGFDFGKFDYGIVDGRVVLYDANRTPAVRSMTDNLPTFRLLAKGIDSFLHQPLKIAG
ncbi:MAG: hypothetical protein ABSB42_16445 [Tepidisphaeraceae bacterium]|jgi:hypothetical protein